MLLRAKRRFCGTLDVMLAEEAISTGDLGGTPWTLLLEDRGEGRLDKSKSFEYADRADMPSHFNVLKYWSPPGVRSTVRACA